MHCLCDSSSLKDCSHGTSSNSIGGASSRTCSCNDTCTCKSACNHGGNLNGAGNGNGDGVGDGKGSTSGDNNGSSSTSHNLGVCSQGPLPSPDINEQEMDMTVGARGLQARDATGVHNTGPCRQPLPDIEFLEVDSKPQFSMDIFNGGESVHKVWQESEIHLDFDPSSRKIEETWSSKISIDMFSPMNVHSIKTGVLKRLIQLDPAQARCQFFPLFVVTLTFSILKVSVDAYARSDFRRWYWVFTSAPALVSEWFAILQLWHMCRPGLPRRILVAIHIVGCGSIVSLRCGSLVAFALDHKAVSDLLSSCGIAVKLFCTIIVFPVVFINYAEPASASCYRTWRQELLPTIVIALLVMFQVFTYAADMMGLVQEYNFAVSFSYAFAIPILLVVVCQRRGPQCLVAPPGQSAPYTVCLTIVNNIPWVIGPTFLRLQAQVANRFPDNVYISGLGQVMCIIGFQMAYVALLYTWDFITRQIMKPEEYLGRPVLAFPLMLSQVLFIELFLINTKPFGIEYFMQLWAAIVSQAFAQCGIGSIMLWWTVHRVRRTLPKNKILSRWRKKMVKASARATSLGAAASQSIIMPQPSDWLLQEGTLNAVLVVHSRRQILENVANAVASGVLLIVVLSESLIFQMQGQPECCEKVDVQTAGRMPCLQHPGGRHFFVKLDLTEICPRVTSRHVAQNRHILIGHFALQLIAFLAAWRLGAILFMRVVTWATRQQSQLESDEERRLSSLVYNQENVWNYLFRHQHYLTCVTVWVVSAVLTSIRIISTGF